MRFLIVFVVLLSGCTGVPKGIEPIEDFELNRYLGTWYEVARLDHRFERGLDNVTAEYSLLDSGNVSVKNRGYSQKKQMWREANGRAKFKSRPEVGHLLVSFFGPFYASYVIFELDDYEQAFVVGSNRNNLWYLSRTPTVSAANKAAFLARTEALGINTDDLIWVEQGGVPE